MGGLQRKGFSGLSLLHQREQVLMNVLGLPAKQG